MGAEVRAALALELCECIVRRRVGYLLSVMCLDPRQPRTLSKLCKICMMYRSTSWSSCRLGPHVARRTASATRGGAVATLRGAVTWALCALTTVCGGVASREYRAGSACTTCTCSML